MYIVATPGLECTVYTCYQMQNLTVVKSHLSTTPYNGLADLGGLVRFESHSLFLHVHVYMYMYVHMLEEEGLGIHT